MGCLSNCEMCIRDRVQSDVSFRGQLDGQGHVVEGLFIDADVTTTTRAGLFCFIGPGAVVKNVGIVKADLKAKFVGSIAAYIEHMDGTPPRISNCFAASSVKIQGAAKQLLIRGDVYKRQVLSPAGTG